MYNVQDPSTVYSLRVVTLIFLILCQACNCVSRLGLALIYIQNVTLHILKHSFSIKQTVSSSVELYVLSESFFDDTFEYSSAAASLQWYHPHQYFIGYEKVF